MQLSFLLDHLSFLIRAFNAIDRGQTINHNNHFIKDLNIRLYKCSSKIIPSVIKVVLRTQFFCLLYHISVYISVVCDFQPCVDTRKLCK